MYSTRPLSEVLKSAELAAAAPDGPNSGYLVIQDEESLTYSCFGCCKNRTLKQLPFPQDKKLTVRYATTSATGDGGTSVDISDDPLFLIPILNHPLSSNRYYAIVPHGKRKGEAFTCSRDDDKTTCCFCRCIKDVKPRPLDPNNIYQQFEIVPCTGACSSRGEFVAKSTASDGYSPYFLRRKGWTIYTKTPRNFKLDDARGLNPQLRAGPPQLHSTEPHIVGKWYTPFIFIKELSLRNQVERSMYYTVTLEQKWERIFSLRSSSGVGNAVTVDARVEKEEVFVGGRRAASKEQRGVDGVVWYEADGVERVGLRVEIVERMKWEERRGGWRGEGGEEREVRINRVEELEGGGGWNEFGCYVLVESFNFRRMDGSLVISYHFKHFHHLKSKWD